MIIPVPQAQFHDWKHRPFSEMAAAVASGELADAREMDREKWVAIPDKDPREKYGFGLESGTAQRMHGYAIFRDSDQGDKRHPDTAWLYMQCW